VALLEKDYTSFSSDPVRRLNGAATDLHGCTGLTEAMKIEA
jgi:hypothetical protein